MTSKDTDTGAEPVSAHALEHQEQRDERMKLVREGLLAPIADLLTGFPFHSDSIQRDIQAWADTWLSKPKLLASAQEQLEADEPELDIRRLIQAFRDSCLLDDAQCVQLALDAIDHDDSTRLRIYRACLGDEGARTELVEYLLEADGWLSAFAKAHRQSVITGLLNGARGSMEAYWSRGRGLIIDTHRTLDELYAAGLENFREAKAAEQAAAQEPDTDFEEDRAEIRRTPSLVVVPKLPENASGHRRDLQKSWKEIHGEPLPIAQRGDIAAHRRTLVERWPHAQDAIDTILGDLAAREEVRIRPTLLVGSPGAGKSSLARAICDQLGLPCQLYSMAGMADASLGGTSAQWSTAREAVPLQLIKQARMATVAVIWDEVEKASADKHNGSALDSLLPLLEPDQAKRFRDLALEVECNLSMVSHFATANSVSDIPAPLRDRMRIIRVPEPGWQHLSQLTRQIIDRIADERGYDRRFYEPLAPDEAEVIRPFWSGGSMRRLTAAIRATLDARDAFMARC